MAGGTIERSCYSPHYVNTERDYERDYQATLPQGRTAADGCKPRHGRDDRKRERSFSGLRKGKGASTCCRETAALTVFLVLSRFYLYLYAACYMALSTDAFSINTFSIY